MRLGTLKEEGKGGGDMGLWDARVLDFFAGMGSVVSFSLWMWIGNDDHRWGNLGRYRWDF